MTMEINSTYRVQVLERALDILDCFGFQNMVLSLADVTNLTGLNKTTVKRLLSNLVDRNYLQQNSETKQYRLGMKLFELGSIVLNSFSLREIAVEPMSRLRNETGYTVLLGVNVDNQMVYIDKLDGYGRITVTSPIGRREALHYGMLGQVLMSSLDPAVVDKIIENSPLQSYTLSSITKKRAFSNAWKRSASKDIYERTENILKRYQELPYPSKTIPVKSSPLLESPFPAVK